MNSHVRVRLCDTSVTEFFNFVTNVENYFVEASQNLLVSVGHHPINQRGRSRSE